MPERNTSGKSHICCWRRMLGLALVVSPPFAQGEPGSFPAPGLMSPGTKSLSEEAADFPGCSGLALPRPP